MADTAQNAETTGEEVALTTAETKPNTDAASEDPATKEPVKEKESATDQSKGRDKACCSCGCVCRWTILILTTPILIVLLAVSLIFWIILLPLKCLCPCIAPCLQCLVDAVTWVLYLPVRFVRWVANKADDDNESETENVAAAEEGKANYGATEEEKK